MYNANMNLHKILIYNINETLLILTLYISIFVYKNNNKIISK